MVRDWCLVWHSFDFADLLHESFELNLVVNRKLVEETDEAPLVLRGRGKSAQKLHFFDAVGAVRIELLLETFANRYFNAVGQLDHGILSSLELRLLFIDDQIDQTSELDILLLVKPSARLE